MKLPRILFIMIGIVAPIFIGALHTYTHFNELISPEIQSYLQKEIPINGESVPIWNAWGLMSFMMGAAFIVIGLLNIGIFTRLEKDEAPPAIFFLIMMSYLSCSIYVGYTFDALPQFYGGIGGLICMIVALFTSLKKS